MAEQAPICSRIKFRTSEMDGPAQWIDGTTYLVAALRNYFADTSIPHYWELDTTTPGGNYQFPSNPAPYDTAANKFSCITLKPKTGASGGLQQRIFILGRENTGQTTRLINGYLYIGYLPDGTFDPVNGLNGTFDLTAETLLLTTPPTAWCPPRAIQGYTGVAIDGLRNYVDIVEYRDDPAIHTDPGQALLIQIAGSMFVSETELLVTTTPTPMKGNTTLDSMNFHCLVGRVIQPFTRYHELAIGNKGDALMCGRTFGGQTTVSTGNQIERYDSIASGRNHSSVVRIAPNVWSGLACQVFGRGERQANAPLSFMILSQHHTFFDGNVEPHPVFVCGQFQSVKNGVLNYVTASALGETATIDPGIYGYGKQWRQTASKYVRPNSYIPTDDPTSNLAWYCPQGSQNATINDFSGRVLMWNKNGATYYNTQYVAGT